MQPSKPAILAFEGFVSVFYVLLYLKRAVIDFGNSQTKLKSSQLPWNEKQSDSKTPSFIETMDMKYGAQVFLSIASIRLNIGLSVKPIREAHVEDPIISRNNPASERGPSQCTLVRLLYHPMGPAGQPESLKPGFGPEHRSHLSCPALLWRSKLYATAILVGLTANVYTYFIVCLSTLWFGATDAGGVRLVLRRNSGFPP